MTEARAGTRGRILRVANPNSSSEDEDRPPVNDTSLGFHWLTRLSSPTSSSADRESPPTPHDPQEPIYPPERPVKTNQYFHPSSSPPLSTVPVRNGPVRRHSPPPLLTSPEPQTSSSPIPTQAIADKTLILVTSDSSLYANVEITGATSAAFIREKIFTALNIFDDDDQSRFSIYRTEIGQYAIGDALPDEKLFELCRASGDSKGSLKLLVSHSSADVHDPSYRPPIQPAHSVTPPVLPQHNPTSPLPQSHPPPPLQPRRRSRSRHGSVSSTSEHAAGYDADLENPVRENGHRNTIRPSSNQTFNCVGVSAPPPSSPLANRRPSAPHLSRPSTPPVSIPTSLHIDRNKERERDRDTIIDKFGNVLQVPPPPPLSPNRLTFDDNSSIRPPTHIRAGSETAAEKQSSDWRSRTRAEPTGLQIGRRPTKQSFDQESLAREQSWVFVDSNQPTAQDNPNTRRSPAMSRGARQQITSPQRHNKPGSPYSRVIPPPPRTDPPPVPTNGGTEVYGKMLSPSRPGGQNVPAHWLVLPWKAEQRVKGAKSTGDLRNLFATGSSNTSLNHPSTLLPGGPSSDRSKRAPPANPPPSTQLPPRPNGLSTNAPRPIRPLPVSGPSTNSRSFASALSPNQDPYPRPQSALGHDTTTSPVLRSQPQQRSYQSPTGDSHESPRTFSPTHHLPPPSSLASRSTHTFHPTPLPTPPQQPPRSSPPRSPTSPRSPPHRLATSISESSSATSPPSASPSDFDGTMKEGKDWLAKLALGTGTAVPLTRSTVIKPLPVAPVAHPPPTNPYDTSSTGTMLSNSATSSESSDDDGGGTWQKLPTAKATQRGPPLSVRIDSASPVSSSSSSKVHPLPIPNPNASSTRDDVASPPSLTLVPQRRSSASRKNKEAKARFRGSTFTAAESDGWATRPPPEDMYERLEEFFPEHDLDRPVIEASSGGTSPTAIEVPPVPPVSPVVEPSAATKARIKGKKSIRIVAEEHKKRIDRTSRALMAGSATESESTFMSNMMRKRSTKLWGSKVEEVTTKASLSHPDSSPGGPTTFKWVRGELIGKGTYGRVYLALNATTGEMMAVKQVDLPRTPSDRNDTRQTTVVQALKLESETLKDLDHPNIVQYLGFEETPANLSIFLEYVPGGSIGSVLLKHGKLSEEVTISFTAQILSGLEYLHSKGILHRDLKADNILVEMGGVCKISDFGISKRTAESDGAGTAMQGTVYWMAPEVINPQGKSYNFKVDIWSLGCVVLEMLAGTRPWTGDEMFAVLFKLYQEKVPPPVPKGVVLSELADDFRRKCFAINPDERPTAAELRKHKYLELPPGWQFTGFS